MRNGDLAHALARLTAQQKFETAVRIVRCLSWAHDNLGIIHRDLKPANVLLDEAELAYVADWGLARPVGHACAAVAASLSPGALQRPDLTQVGAFVGTVTFAAPEQLLGSSTVDHRADIYSLGCILFALEAGRPPFEGAIATAHCQTAPRSRAAASSARASSNGPRYRRHRRQMPAEEHRRQVCNVR
ncbi:MAG: protein kinase [Holophagales bacterium]|nr:protein kinase [Holophagales bacterium]